MQGDAVRERMQEIQQPACSGWCAVEKGINLCMHKHGRIRDTTRETGEKKKSSNDALHPSVDGIIYSVAREPLYKRRVAAIEASKAQAMLPVLDTLSAEMS